VANPVGRPRKYKTAKALQTAIDAYFALPGLKSIGGLTLYLGFVDREALLDYCAKGEFSFTVKHAKARIANYYEEQAQTRPNSAFQIFALKNFGWSDRQELEHSGSVDTGPRRIEVVMIDGNTEKD